METTRKISFILMAVLSSVFCQAYMNIASAAGDYPSRPIQIIVGYEPGGSADARARGLVPTLEKVLGQPVIVVNKPGASGGVGLVLVAKAKPDGYNLGTTATSGLIFTPHMQKVEYDTLADFTYICGIAIQPGGIVVRNDAPWKSMGELIDYVKKNPGQVKYGSMGMGSVGHVYMEVFGKGAGLKWTHIPFKGDVPCIVALLGGHIPVACASSSFVPYVRAGKLRVLAMITENRVPTFPQVPTLKELGSTHDYRAYEANGVCGPKGLPPEVLRKLEPAMKQAVESPENREMMEKFDMVPKFRGSQEMTQMVHELYRRVGEMIREVGIGIGQTGK